MNNIKADILISNLIKIYNSETESLHKNDFDHSPLEVNEIISILTECDLIETESNPNIFFLTPETYELIESGDIEDLIYGHLLTMESNYLEYDEFDANEEDMIIIENDLKAKRSLRLTMLFIYISIGVTGSWIIYNTRNEKKVNEQKEIFQNVTLIDHKGDTIRLE